MRTSEEKGMNTKSQLEIKVLGELECFASLPVVSVLPTNWLIPSYTNPDEQWVSATERVVCYGTCESQHRPWEIPEA